MSTVRGEKINLDCVYRIHDRASRYPDVLTDSARFEARAVAGVIVAL